MTLECPVCGFPLRDGRASGFRCVKCHAHYSARFVARLRRELLRDLLRTHFTAQPAQPAPIASSTVLLAGESSIVNGKREERVLAVLEETKESAREAATHLARVLHADAQRKQALRSLREKVLQLKNEVESEKTRTHTIKEQKSIKHALRKPTYTRKAKSKTPLKQVRAHHSQKRPAKTLRRKTVQRRTRIRRRR